MVEHSQHKETINNNNSRVNGSAKWLAFTQVEVLDSNSTAGKSKVLTAFCPVRDSVLSK